MRVSEPSESPGCPEPAGGQGEAGRWGTHTATWGAHSGMWSLAHPPAVVRPAASGWWGCAVGLAAFFAGNILGGILAVTYWFAAGGSLVGLGEAAESGALLTNLGVVLASSLGLWAGLAGGCWLYSRAVLSTSFSSFYRVRFRGWRDIGVGLGVGVGVQVVLIAVQVALAGLGVEPEDEKLRDNTNFLSAQLDNPVGLMLAVAVAVVGAPLFEELFFRGLVMGSMRRVLQTGWAVALSSMLFGAVHFQGGGGILAWLTVLLGLGLLAHIESRCARGFTRRQVRNRWRLGLGVALPVLAVVILAAEGGGGLLIMSITGLAGVALALLRVRTGRLGPGIVAHGAFNATAVMLLVLGLQG